MPRQPSNKGAAGYHCEHRHRLPLGLFLARVLVAVIDLVRIVGILHVVLLGDRCLPSCRIPLLLRRWVAENIFRVNLQRFTPECAAGRYRGELLSAWRMVWVFDMSFALAVHLTELGGSAMYPAAATRAVINGSPDPGENAGELLAHE